ncbi:unknown protein [Desulfotalea psychrophila LSv54]|uniref:Uncharacterized protein n=1 Tax=Desulfotalea psychrophila (strain LSv54 / DSM 12343) TaxID=177439 RepID=Q6ALH0_DESPS|nr:unknown protein [Desulfotalea psychrophila LSv54]
MRQVVCSRINSSRGFISMSMLYHVFGRKDVTCRSPTLLASRLSFDSKIQVPKAVQRATKGSPVTGPRRVQQTGARSQQGVLFMILSIRLQLQPFKHMQVKKKIT